MVSHEEESVDTTSSKISHLRNFRQQDSNMKKSVYDFLRDKRKNRNHPERTR